MTDSSGFYSSLYKKEKKKIDSILNKAFLKREPVSLYEPVSYILNGEGKRLRPLLVLLSTGAVGGKFNKAYNAAAAVEMLHNFTLVHDDIMDNAPKRRNKITLHIKYDSNTALLVGDSLLAVAYEYLLKDCDGNAKFILSAFTKGLVEVCEGQKMDMEFETQKNVNISEYLLMIKKKTAAMAEMCCKVGAALGNGSKQQIKALANYGLNLGIAFQIQDDLLDITAEETEFGKKIGGDLMEGKKTFLFIRALEESRNNDKDLLLKVIKNKGIRADQVKKYKALYEKLGVIQDAKDEIKYYTKKALNSLKIIDEEPRRMLHWLADSLLKRTK
jgi:geranylgeranyl diphosphate synthase, type II